MAGVGPSAAALAARAARRRVATYVVFLVATVVLMAFSSAEPIVEVQKGIGFAFRPLQAALTSVARTGASITAALTEIDGLRRDNARLIDENARLRAENARAVELARENELLTGLLQLRNGLQFATVTAIVIGRDASDFRRVITIDVGTAQGIAVGDVVIAAGGALAGRVVQVGRDAANVVLINDTSSTVIGQLQASAATGEIDGQLGGVLVMRNIDSTEKILIGDEVVTAGIELQSGVRSPYPKGLVVGQVVDVIRDANAVVQTAYLQPTADLDRLEYVLVITDYEGGLPDLGEQPTEVTNDDGTLPDSEQPFVTPDPAAPSPTPVP
ncbi:MAG: rod shape-determining protein MreC [Chloroflexota bacterium]